MVHLFEVLFSFSHLVYNNECKPHNIKLTQSSQTSLFGSWEYSLHWKPHIFRGWISQKCAGFSSGSSWTNPLIFHILWVAEVETWLLPQEVSHGGPLWPVPVHGGVGQGEWGRKGGGGIFRLKCGFQDGGGLWRMAMTAAFVFASASFGTMGSEWCCPGEGAPLSLARRGQKGRAGEERKECKERQSEVLTRALNEDAALQGQPLLLLWFY